MFEESLELVRRTYAEWSRGNMSAGVELFDPEIRFESFMPDANTRIVVEGPNDVAAFMRDFLGQWRDYRLMADEFEAVRDDVVFVRGHQTGTGRQSGVPVEGSMCSGWAFRGGKVAHLVFNRDRETVLSALGLPE